MAFSAEAEKQQKLSILAKDSGAGFLIEEDEVNTNSKKEEASSSNRAERSGNESGSSVKCLECNRKVVSSFLKSHFDVNVCDECREDRGKHDMITRTDAKNEYLLKDCDLDSREPPLRFILKKNPHEKARGDMKLYLRMQVEERALRVWGSFQSLDEEKDKRGIKRKERKQKQYQKTIKQLRMSVQSSLFTKTASKHEHDFSEKVLVDEDNDMYQQTCKTCGHVVTFEEL